MTLRKNYWLSGFDHILIFRREQISLFLRIVELTCCVASG